MLLHQGREHTSNKEGSKVFYTIRHAGDVGGKSDEAYNEACQDEG